MVLDLATGTGDVALLIAKQTKEKSKIIAAVDPSKNMIEIAQKKSIERNMTKKIYFELGNAMDMNNMKDSVYTKVSMSFGIRNIPDRMKALKEIRRVMVKRKYNYNESTQNHCNHLFRPHLR